MGCGCGNSGCGGPPCPYAPRSTVFTTPTPALLARSLVRKLQGPVDKIRDLNTRFGRRPYIVRFIYTGWSGGARGDGQEYLVREEVILPVPLVVDLASLQELVSPVGVENAGSLILTEVSGCYTEEQLRGLSNTDGSPTPADQNFYYEIEFIRPDGVDGVRRRFQVAGTPEEVPDKFQWRVRLDRAQPGRARSGAIR